MKLNKKLSHRYLDGTFRLILLIYGRLMKKYLLKVMQDNFGNSIIINLTKKKNVATGSKN